MGVPALRGSGYTGPREDALLGAWAAKEGNGDWPRGLADLRTSGGLGAAAEREPQPGARSGFASEQQDRVPAADRPLGVPGEERRLVPERCGAGATGRPPGGLTQKFPLNSEPVMAGASAGAEESGAATARVGRLAVTARSPAAQLGFSPPPGGPPPGPKPRPVATGRGRALRLPPRGNLKPRPRRI